MLTENTLTLEEILNKLNSKKTEENSISAMAKSCFSSLAMPLGSLGKLEDLIVKICTITNDINPSISKRGVVVFCADHGIVAQNVSQVGSEVTYAVANKLCTNDTVMCSMAKFSNCDVIPVDVGMKNKILHKNILQYSLGFGTNDFSKENAMTLEQARKSIEIGIKIAVSLHKQGYELLITGEMGIGNTTSASAMASVLLDIPPKDITGRGAGLSDETLAHKIEVIENALLLHNISNENPLEILQKVGGFELGAMAGLMLGCAYCNIPCVVDGFLSNVSALLGCALCEDLKEYLIFSHATAEKGGKLVLNALNEKPVLQADFRLGEGSGGVALLPLLDMGLNVFKDGITFDEMEIQSYSEF